MRFTVMQTASSLRMDLGAQDPNTRGGIFDDVRKRGEKVIFFFENLSLLQAEQAKTRHLSFRSLHKLGQRPPIAQMKALR